MKARRIPLGLIYIASLILLVVLIPTLRFYGPEAARMMHRQSSALALRMDKMKL